MSTAERETKKKNERKQKYWGKNESFTIEMGREKNRLKIDSNFIDVQEGKQKRKYPDDMDDVEM